MKDSFINDFVTDGFAYTIGRYRVGPITKNGPKNTKSKYSIDTYQLKGYNIITYYFLKRGICIYANII